MKLLGFKQIKAYDSITPVDTPHTQYLYKLTDSKKRFIYVAIDKDLGMIDGLTYIKIKEIGLKLEDHVRFWRLDRSVNISSNYQTDDFEVYKFWKSALDSIFEEYESSLDFWEDHESLKEYTIKQRPDYERIHMILEDWIQRNNDRFYREEEPEERIGLFRIICNFFKF